MYMLRAISVYLGYILSILVMCASQPQDKLNRPQNQLSQAIGVAWFRNYTITVVMSVPISATALVVFDIAVYKIATCQQNT
jgi:hypothetical protein